MKSLLVLSLPDKWFWVQDEWKLNASFLFFTIPTDAGQVDFANKIAMGIKQIYKSKCPSLSEVISWCSQCFYGTAVIIGPMIIQSFWSEIYTFLRSKCFIGLILTFLPLCKSIKSMDNDRQIHYDLIPGHYLSTSNKTKSLGWEYFRYCKCIKPLKTLLCITVSMGEFQNVLSVSSFNNTKWEPMSNTTL